MIQSSYIFLCSTGFVMLKKIARTSAIMLVLLSSLSLTYTVDSSTCPPVLVLPPVTGCDGLVLTDPSSIDTQSAGIITNIGGGIGGTDSTTVNNGESIDILNSGCFQLGKDGNDFALSFWLKATGATQIIGTKTQYNSKQGFIVFG